MSSLQSSLQSHAETFKACLAHQKDAKWRCPDEEEEAFLSAKQLLMSSEVLIHFDSKKQLLLSCDSSQYEIRAVLSHQLLNGLKRTIGFGSQIYQMQKRATLSLELRRVIACTY